mgnify:CR=1 FL=1
MDHRLAGGEVLVRGDEEVVAPQHVLVGRQAQSAGRRVERGKQPVIREFEVTSVYSALHPVEHATGAWKNGDMGNYSAVATAFACELYKELGIPILDVDGLKKML